MEIDPPKPPLETAAADEDDSADLAAKLESGEDKDKNDVQSRMKILNEIVTEVSRDTTSPIVIKRLN